MLLDKHERGDTAPFAGGVSALQFTTAICDLRKKNISVIGHFEIESVPMLCRIAPWDCLSSFFLLATAVAKETGSKTVPKTVPRCNLRQHRPSLSARLQNGRRSITLFREQKAPTEKASRLINSPPVIYFPTTGRAADV